MNFSFLLLAAAYMAFPVAKPVFSCFRCMGIGEETLGELLEQVGREEAAHYPQPLKDREDLLSKIKKQDSIDLRKSQLHLDNNEKANWWTRLNTAFSRSPRPKN